MTPDRVLVVAGEASGDAHAAQVLEGLRNLRPAGVEARGMGGPQLAAAGLQIDVDIRETTGMGAAEILGRAPRLAAAFLRLLRLASRTRPDAALLVDVPDFNLPLGRRLRRMGIPVLGYVAPQLWAWRAGRAPAVAASFDELACVLPFEEPLLRGQGVPATFVGHPALDLPALDREAAQETLGLGSDSQAKCLALLPGSRPAEVGQLLEPMVRAAARVRRRRSGPLQVLLALAPSLKRLPAGLPHWVRQVTMADRQSPGRLALAAADAALVASGTATLEAALQGTPQVAAYRLAGPTYFAARLLVRTRFFALPNLLLRAQVVPELLQHEVNVDTLAAHAERLLDNECARSLQAEAATRLRALLTGPGASETTAAMLESLLRSRA